MFYRRKGLPRVSEIVYCEVKNIQRGGVFVKLEEYDTDAILPIPEVSPGRIRNIREYVKPGKKIVCVVLYVNTNNGHITVSLRRVSDKNRREKLETIKQEMTAESVITFLSHSLGIDKKKLYDTVKKSISSEYEYLYDFFSDIVEGNVNVRDLISDEKIASSLEAEVIHRIKPKRVRKKLTANIKIFAGDGVVRIRNVFKKIVDQCNSFVDDKNMLTFGVTYLGGGKYSIETIAKDFDTVNKVIDSAYGILKENFENAPDVVFKSEILKGEKIR